jgi:hypothetical protein
MREVNPRKNNSKILLASFLLSLFLVLVTAMVKIALQAFLSVIWLTIPFTIIIFVILKSRDGFL